MMVAHNTQLTNEQDRELARRVSIFLFSRHLPGLRGLNVEARDGVVTVRGKVGSYYEKQLSHQLSRRVAGVTRLIDEVTVEDPRDRAAAFFRTL